jgi:hypothetical protein
MRNLAKTDALVFVVQEHLRGFLEDLGGQGCRASAKVVDVRAVDHGDDGFGD